MGKLFFWIAIVCVVVLLFGRMAGYNDSKPMPIMAWEVTPAAFERLADTFLLLAISVFLMKIAGCKGKGQAGKEAATTKTSE